MQSSVAIYVPSSYKGVSDYKIEADDINQPSEIASLGFQILLSTLTVIISIPTRAFRPLSYYGTAWWVGIILYFSLVIIQSIFLRIMSETWTYITFRIIISTVVLILSGTIINSLYMHSTFIYFPYYTSLDGFFGGEVFGSILVGMVAIIILSFIPREKSVENRNFVPVMQEYLNNGVCQLKHEGNTYKFTCNPLNRKDIDRFNRIAMDIKTQKLPADNELNFTTYI